MDQLHFQIIPKGIVGLGFLQSLSLALCSGFLTVFKNSTSSKTFLILGCFSQHRHSLNVSAAKHHLWHLTHSITPGHPLPTSHWSVLLREETFSQLCHRRSEQVAVSMITVSLGISAGNSLFLLQTSTGL